MQRRVLVFTILLVCILSFSVQAASEDSGKVDKAYQCLEKQVSSKALSSQEATFSALAIGDKNNISSILNGDKSSDGCWPKSGCKIKETAQATLAYQRLGQSTTDSIKWLLSKNGSATELAWYLEIDTEKQQPSSCSVKYDGVAHQVNIGQNLALSGSPGSCLSISSSGYLLKVRDNCLDRTYEISCNQSFVSTVLYQKNRGDNVDCLSQSNVTCYVSGETHAAASLGTTQEKISASCFKSGNNCDYEGSLWAALALAKTGNSIANFVPYLLALAEDYPRFMPDAFLTVLVGDDASYSNLIQNRKQNQYWEQSGSPYNRYYDSALGMLGLSAGTGSNELEATKSYLLGIQTSEGCWNNNNIRDTAFLLYAGWPRNVPGGAGSGTGTGSTLCTEARYSCEKLGACQDAGGRALQGFECSGVSICCSVKVPKQTCNQLEGKICSGQQSCDGKSLESSDGACCVGSCTSAGSNNVCEEQTGGICKNSCSVSEDETSDSCGSSGGVCCLAKPKSGNSLWIWILGILIILVIIAIMFRHRIQIWWFTRRGKIKSTPVTKGPPPAPAQMMRRPVVRPAGFLPVKQNQQRPAQRKPESKEYEDTLKKLRELGK